MKITKKQLREIIKEELQSVNEENFNRTKFLHLSGDAYEHIITGLDILKKDIPVYLKKNQQDGLLTNNYQKLVSDLDKTLNKLATELGKLI